MTDRKSTLLALADRVKAGETGSAFEMEILQALNLPWNASPALTINLQTIDALRERELPGSFPYIECITANLWASHISREGADRADCPIHTAPTICAAYLSAVLRAIAEKEQDHG